MCPPKSAGQSIAVVLLKPGLSNEQCPILNLKVTNHMFTELLEGKFARRQRDFPFERTYRVVPAKEMIMRTLALVLLSLTLWALPVEAQQWSGILDSSRATNWSSVGATILDRKTQCGSTIAAYNGSASTINSAISSCGANQFVQLGTGTFTLSSGI